MTTADLIGIFGVICYQIAYAGLQLGFLHSEDRPYIVLNLIGPSCLLYSLLFHFNLAAAVSQVLWLVWSGVGIRKIVLAQRGASLATLGDSLSLSSSVAPHCLTGASTAECALGPEVTLSDQTDTVEQARPCAGRPL